MPTATELEEAFYNATNLKKALDKGKLDGTVSRDTLDNLFEGQSDWNRPNKNNGGHAHLKHPITGVHVGYQQHNRGGRKSNDVNKGIVKELKEKLYEHLDILAKKLRIRVADFHRDFKPNFDVAAGAASAAIRVGMFSQKTNKKGHTKHSEHPSRRSDMGR